MKDLIIVFILSIFPYILLIWNEKNNTKNKDVISDEEIEEAISLLVGDKNRGK